MATSIQNASDSELIDIATQTFNAINGNLGDYPGVTQQMIDDLKAFTNTFSSDLTTHVASQAQAKADRLTKDASREPVESQLSTVRNLSKAGGSTEAAMSATGIPVSSVKAPSATRPSARVDTSQRLQHTIHWTDEATPDNKKKPRGSMGAEIWAKFGGPPPTDETECTFLTLDAFTPYVKDYSGSDAGKMAVHYLVRWRMRDGSLSAWGETVSSQLSLVETGLFYQLNGHFSTILKF